MEKVSVIMSAYNTEKFIGRAIDSVLNQDYPEIELVIVEDKSTDKTLDVIKEKMTNHPNIVLVEHKVNKGAGWSRYDGIKVATGEYTTFLDSDDYLSKDAISTMMKAAKETGADIVSPGYTSVEEGKEDDVKIPKKQVLEGNAKFAIDPSDTLRFLNPALVRATLWNKVEYSKRRFVEDSPTLIKLLYHANKRAVIDYAGYHYYQNSNSLTHTSSDFRTHLYSVLCTLDTVDVFGPETSLYVAISRILDVAKHDKRDNNYKEEIDEIANKTSDLIKTILYE